MQLQQYSDVSDLKLGAIDFLDLAGCVDWPDEYRKTCFLTTDGLDSPRTVPTVCRTISGRIQSSKFFMLGSIPVHGIRAADLTFSGNNQE